MEREVMKSANTKNIYTNNSEAQSSKCNRVTIFGIFIDIGVIPVKYEIIMWDSLLCKLHKVFKSHVSYMYVHSRFRKCIYT